MIWLYYSRVKFNNKDIYKTFYKILIKKKEESSKILPAKINYKIIGCLPQ